MSDERIRRLLGFIVQYGVVYPSIATGGAYLASRVFTASFDGVLFAVFAIAAVLTGFSAMSGPSSNHPTTSRFGSHGTADAGDSWGASTIIKLVLFDVGLAALVTIYTVGWVNTG